LGYDVSTTKLRVVNLSIAVGMIKELRLGFRICWAIEVHRVIQEARSVLWEGMVSVIVRKWSWY